MGTVKFQGYRIHVIKLENFIRQNHAELNLSHIIKTKVEYDHSQNKCACFYNVDIKDKDNKQPFSITVQISGLFSYDPGMNKKEIHVEAARQLFPYLRTTVSNVTTTAGLPPLMIPDQKITADSIQDQAEIEGSPNPDNIRS